MSNLIMKNIFKFAMLCMLPVFFGSCLKKDLPEVTNSSLNNITDFRLLYKYQDTIVDNAGTPNENTRIVVNTVQLDGTVTISGNTVNVTPGFPSGFPQSEKPKVTLTHIWGVAYIPDAATIAPLNGAPELGTPGDYSSPVTYRVTAADGSTQDWTISVSPLPVVNQYEGNYHSTGYFYHPSSPRSIDADKYLTTIDENTVKVELGDLGGSNYYANIKINSDNSLTITAADGAEGAPYTMFTSGLPDSDPGYTAQWDNSAECNNTYDPSTKTFYVRYGYMGSTGWRVTEEILQAY